MIKKNCYKSLIDQYYNLNEKTKEEKSHYEKAALLESQAFISNIIEIQNKLGKKFPHEYVDFISSGGLTGFENDYFQIYLYNEKDLYEFNIGESSYEEMKDFICFGQDGGSYTYFFDPTNKLDNGTEAVYRVSRSTLGKEYFIFLSKDFKSLFSSLLKNQQLNSDYLKKKIQSSENDKLSEQNKGLEILNTIRQSSSQNQKIQIELDKVISIISNLPDYEYGYNMTDEDFYIIEKIQNEYSTQLPNFYLCLLDKLRGGSYSSVFFWFQLYDRGGLEAYNFDEKKEIFKDFIIIGTDIKMNPLFIDPKKLLSINNEAIYYIEKKARKITDATKIANNFLELFNLLLSDQKPY